MRRCGITVPRRPGRPTSPQAASAPPARFDTTATSVADDDGFNQWLANDVREPHERNYDQGNADHGPQ
ncbi:MAG: hypothetical protein ACSLFK_08230, partial [Gemmatimonadaceae bacterium]